MAVRPQRFRPRLPGDDGSLGEASPRTADRLWVLVGSIGAIGWVWLLLGHPSGPGTGAGRLDGHAAAAAWILGAVAALAWLYWLTAQAAEARRERQDLAVAGEVLRGLLGSTAEGVVLVDAGLRIRLLNPAAEILFGRLADEALGAPLETLVPALGAPADALPGPGEEAGSARVRQLVGLRGSGEEFPVRLLLRDLACEGEPWLLVLAEDLTDRERTEAELDFLTHHDPLTGLSNRRTFERVVASTASDPARAALPHALCVIDLDHFKAVKSTYGHAAADKLLHQVSQIVSTKLADASAVARLGGDELAALFVGDAAARAEAECEELVRTVRSFLFTWEERSYDVSLSVGLATFRPGEGVAGALGRADLACQVAQSQGGDRLHVYRPGDGVGVRHQGEQELLTLIGRALDQGRFRIFVQPIQPLGLAGGPRHYEVLVRMQDDQGKSVTPDRFIPAAERHVLMPAVDRWVLAHLLSRRGEDLRTWCRHYPDRFLFAVNLSATTLMDDSFLPYLRRQFAENGVPYSGVCFEITETTALADLGRAREFIQDLRDLGCSFAVDDFGSGFASYAYLKSLPVSFLKIDGSFVSNLERDPVDRAFVESINRIGHVLGLETIAEWVETPGILDVLRTMGVDYAQGFGVGDTVPLTELLLEHGGPQGSPAARAVRGTSQ